MKTIFRHRAEDEALEDARDSLKASVDYFSSSNKAARERWVCEAFLENIGSRFKVSEVKNPAEEPPDVIFRSARFEIKEVLDKDRKRHGEYKRSYQRALEAKSVDDLIKSFEPKDLTASDILLKVEEILLKYSQRYSLEVRAKLDLLIYVNLMDHFTKDSPMPATHDLNQYGWRSVSAISGSHAYIFHAVRGAPRFLVLRRGTCFRRHRA